MSLYYGRVTFSILLLLQFHWCFAAPIVYVNVNNPTPGAGTTWATAYNDLNAAFAAAPYGANIWVAQGTYKPTATTDRTIAFEPPKYALIYGGFVGTETLLTQRDYKNNPTILSGDIGITGDASDNSYNVVRFNAGSNGASHFNGFTIRDGNANYGYPGSTTPSEYNQGGGLLLFANVAGTYNYAQVNIENCTFLNNFAVYGGAYSSYSSPGNVSCNAFALSCVFDHNTAVMGGGAFATVSVQAVTVITGLQNCVFTNNNTTVGTGSAIASFVDGNQSAMVTTIYNCDFYNNPLPVISNTEQNGQISTMDFWYCIFWNPTPFPANSFVNAGDVKYHFCDIDQATVPTSNVNFDPLFINAAAGDLHVSSCSQVIDYGGNMTYSQWPVDLDGNPRVLGPGVDLGAYETLKAPPPAAPSVSSPNPTYCQGAAVTTDLSGLVLSPVGTLVWYDAANTLLSAAPIPPTSTVTSTIYYVSQSTGAGCESAKIQITATVKAAPATPADPLLSYCLNTTPANLNTSITRQSPTNTLTWYTDATGSTALSTTPGISTATAGDQYFYVTQKALTGCESKVATIDVIVKKTDAPVTNHPSPAYCQGAAADMLDITGTGLLWYTASSGGSGTVLTTIPTPSTSTTGTQNYYISQTVAGCESQRTAINVTVENKLPAPAATGVNYCMNEPAAALKATGSDLEWYTTASGGTGVTDAPLPATTASGSTTWYVTQSANGTCESKRTAVTVTVNAPPVVSINFPDKPYCPGSSVQLEASGAASYQWSPAANLSDPSVSNPLALLQRDISYTVTGTDVNGCPARTQVDLQVSDNCDTYPMPSAFTPNGDGHNDLFRVVTYSVPKSFSMQIFNRYGERIFSSTDVNTGWDGTRQGSQMESGTYVYIVMITTTEGKVLHKKGTVILIR
jgi:gliding motility-associated-like protein